MPPPIRGTTPKPHPTVTPRGRAAGPLKNGRFAGEPTLASVAAGKATLGKGASGDAVKKVQTALLDMGFSLRPWTEGGKPVGGIDGGYGEQTANALGNFQRHAAHFFPGVKPTGLLDAATIQALDALAPKAGNKAWAPGETPRVPSPLWGGDRKKPLRVVVLHEEHRTFLYDKAGKCIGIFSNASGASANLTHQGYKTVATRLDKKAAEAVGQQLWKDPQAFGDRILDLSWAEGANRSSGEELHGTYDYKDMGKDVSHGCMRHYNEDIVTIFNALAVGDKVAVVESFTDPRLTGKKR